MSSIKELLDFGRTTLADAGNEYAKYEAKVLLEEVLQKSYMQMLLNESEEIPQEKAQEYKTYIDRRLNHYPLQYILGYTHFMDFQFDVSEDVLIPRNDTECLVEHANSILEKEISISVEDSEYRVLDMCCGSGCIGISLKLYHKELDLTLCDISDAAISLTKKNLSKHQLTANIIQSDLFEMIDEKYNMIISNPPYIEKDVIPTLMSEVKDYEPMLALDGGEDGLDFYKVIVENSRKHLNNNGYLLFEIGYNQGEAVSKLMETAGYVDIEIIKDYAGMDRVVSGHL